MSMQLEKYSLGMGDRFGQQGRAQLQALVAARHAGVEIVPVWNKSNREHTLVKTQPDSVLLEAQDAVRDLKWGASYYVDADHINLKNVDPFLGASNFFTLDVADAIGKAAAAHDIDDFVESFRSYIGKCRIPGLENPVSVTEPILRTIGDKYLFAVQQAAAIYRHIEQTKGRGNFVTEVSMDETTSPQTPVELFFILGAIAKAGIPAQTIAPKFCGEFHKGIDYIGDTKAFSQEFSADLAVLAFAAKEFGLPTNLKLSVHSGSDKFSIYRPIREALTRFDAGLHLKTAGTTWLEEVIGLAMAGSEALDLVKMFYFQALERFDELCAPYATVVSIDRTKLPTPADVRGWGSAELVSALRHDRHIPQYNPNLRQLLHVSFRLAAEVKEDYLALLQRHAGIVGRNVTENLLERHVRPLFLHE